MKILFAAMAINLLECSFGMVSLKYHGYHTWNYEHASTCSGYISLYVGIGWTFLATMFFLLCDIV
jgi:hypothetical protein